MKAKDTPIHNVSATEWTDKCKAVITIVGVGNEFRGDDAVGLAILRELKGKVPVDVRTVELVGDQSSLLELMRSTNAMIIVDAVQSLAPAGTIFRVDLSEECAPKDLFPFSTHSIDSMQAVEIARALNTLPTKVFVYGVVGKDFSYNSKLSPEVSESVEIIQEKILDDIGCILKN